MPKSPIQEDGQESIIEAFHSIQTKYNYIPADELKMAACRFGYSETQAYGVASFYSYFSQVPRGRNIIRICTSTPCMLDGSDDVLQAIQDLLGIKVGETTADGEFTLESTECVGQCQQAPVLTINRQPYSAVDLNQLPSLLDAYRFGHKKEGALSGD